MLPPTPSVRALGRSHLRVSSLSYGFWRFAGTSVSEARAKVETALEAGFTLMDHADIYGCDGGGDTERCGYCDRNGLTAHPHHTPRQSAMGAPPH